MLRILPIIVFVLTLIHGLIHFMGWVAYWPLTQIQGLPYKTTLLAGRIDLGGTGMRAYSLLWLLAGLGFVAAALALAFKQPIWTGLMLVSVLLSMVAGILDWAASFRGVLFDLVLLLIVALVFGLRVQPQPFPAYRSPAEPVQTMPLPAGLPEPVEKFYRRMHGDEIPVYHSAVISGRGTARFMGITFPARLRFTHLVGQGYRHYIETTLFGLPILKVNEYYLDGHTRLELPFGVIENDPGVDSAANQGLWAETAAYPAAYLTNPRVHWEAVDSTSAKLYVPFGEDEQVFNVSFDPDTGLISRIETLRYRDEKVGFLRWWGEFSFAMDALGEPGQLAMTITWEDEGSPWLVVTVENILFNSDVSSYIRQKGP